MKKRFFNWCGGMLLTLALIGFSSCTDDHFSIDSTVADRQTLWEAISADSELSEYANILSRVYFSKREGSTTVQTYADLLNGDQTFTVWAPKNGTFNYEAWKALLDEGTVSSIYRVENELIRNNMTRFSHQVSGADSMILDLFNGKIAMFNTLTQTIKGQHIDRANIGASNGILHVINGPVSFLHNLYEYMAAQPELDSLYKYIKKHEKITFNEVQSTPGPSIDGEVTWVDSVTYIQNTFLTREMNALLNNEDSCYAVVMPTNSAWKTAYEKALKYFTYQPKYSQTVVPLDGQVEEGTQASAETTEYTTEEWDSIARKHARDFLAENIAFNMNDPVNVNKDRKSVVEDFGRAGACDSLRNTVYNVFYDPESANIFSGIEPVKLSNGYAFVTDNYNIPTKETYLKKKDMSAFANMISYNSTYSDQPTAETLSWNLQTDLEKDGEGNVINSTDTLFTEKTVLYVKPKGRGNPEVTFRLPNTLSCKYDIYVVTIYNAYVDMLYAFRAEIQCHKGSEKAATPDKLQNPADNSMIFTNRPMYNEDGTLHLTDTVLVQRNYEFPSCYYGLTKAYPTLKIVLQGNTDRNKYTNQMYIDRIILVPKENED